VDNPLLHDVHLKGGHLRPDHQLALGEGLCGQLQHHRVDELLITHAKERHGSDPAAVHVQGHLRAQHGRHLPQQARRVHRQHVVPPESEEVPELAPQGAGDSLVLHVGVEAVNGLIELLVLLVHAQDDAARAPDHVAVRARAGDHGDDNEDALAVRGWDHVPVPERG